MRNLLRGDNNIGAALFDLFADLLKALGRGIGFMLMVVLVGAVIGAAGGAFLSFTEDWPMLYSVGFGAMVGAFIALLGMILVAFTNGW